MEGALHFLRWGARTGSSERMSRNFRDRLCRKHSLRELEGDRLAGARGQQTRACVAVQEATRADMMSGPVRSVLRRRFGWLLCGAASEA